ncbi:MAG: hypothetical protein DRP56_07130 [Planctomycetota bacterium]|nr:MAG: hypothetical protein DRP56_07130 [Planctomycetota bacterium]
MTDGSRLLKIREVAEHISCSERTVWTLISTGQLQAIKLSKRMTRVMFCDLEYYIEKLRKTREWFDF